eukprot:gb/GEZN01006418.1/.p1 GENE.gb/GEZN01006418.1/~~gb/GEZN01006418.1/.p1  ORF type:complete len:296 (-),score=8.17 gb/GEZN01006418.1/:779-1645(-)
MDGLFAGKTVKCVPPNFVKADSKIANFRWLDAMKSYGMTGECMVMSRVCFRGEIMRSVMLNSDPSAFVDTSRPIMNQNMEVRHVNDIAHMATNAQDRKNFVAKLDKHFPGRVKDLRDIRGRRRIVHQQPTILATSYVRKLTGLEKFSLPEMIGLLIHASMNTQPLISAPLNEAALHPHIAYRILRYLQNERGLLFPWGEGSSALVPLVDPEFAACKKSRRSRAAFLTCRGGPIAWHSGGQSVVAQPTLDFDYSVERMRASNPSTKGLPGTAFKLHEDSITVLLSNHGI